MFHFVGAAAPVIDMALVAGMTLFFVQVVFKPLIALLVAPKSAAYDSAVPAVAVLVAAGLIGLATYLPAAFTILSESVAVATGAVGTYRLAKGSPADPTPPDPAK